MGTLLRFVKRNTKLDYDFDRIADILVRKKVEHRSDLKMLRNLIRDLSRLETNPELAKQIWEGIGYQYIKRGKVFAYSERDLEDNEKVEEVLIGTTSLGVVPGYKFNKSKYLFRAEAEYMEIKRLASDICSIEPNLLTEGLNLNFSSTVIAGYFKMEDAMLMDLELMNKPYHELVEDFVGNKYRQDKVKQNSVYYMVARCLIALHTDIKPFDLGDYVDLLIGLQKNFRVYRYIEKSVKAKYIVQQNCNVGYIKSEKGSVLDRALNTTLLLHDLLLTLDFKELAKAYELQRPIYLCCFGNYEFEEEQTAY